ncbi:hypothetical protein GGR54DRAFT_628735 [Hypoxylon sp. NC1633]|nr:hypothetical protein GGR54DRAFT_628735 [Hypoxylon sp. NC1633]
MRSRSKTCSYPTDRDGTAGATPPQREPSHVEATSKVSDNVADDNGECLCVSQNSFLRRELWQSSALGSVSVKIPSGSKPDPDGSTSTGTGAPTLGTTDTSKNGYSKGNRPSATHGLRTNSTVSSYMDQYPINGIIVKKRYVSTTHWMFAMTLSPHALDWLDEQVRYQKGIWQDLLTCKYLARSIKARRVLPWTQGQYGKHLPARKVADDLFNAYLRTFESVYRIIHVPTSTRTFEGLWENLDLVSLANPGYIVQFQLCLAIGACVYDDTFTLRPQALQWIREAEHWLGSSGKLRLTVFDIQTRCLLHLARQTTQFVREHQVWASSGALIRAAMSVGLHRDPTRLPNMPVLEAEMRRRLWATIIELALDASVDAGGPPMLSFDDFDCSLPSNLNDVELDLNHEVSPHGLDERTDTTIQIVLGWTFPVRLAIAKYANGMRVDTSREETLKLSTELMTRYRTLMKSLHSMRPPPSKFQQQYCELVLSRYIFALHLPDMPRALKDPVQFYFSRATCLDIALRLSSFFLPLSSSRQEPLLEAMHSILPFDSHCVDFTRLLTCGSDQFRSLPFRASMVIAAELTATIHQAQSTSPWLGIVPFSQTHSSGRTRSVELLSFLRESTKWTMKRIQAGHHNVKDLVYIVVVLAGIEAAMEGSPAEAAMDAKGKETTAEVIRILAEMTGTGIAMSETPPDLGDEGHGDASEFWSMGFSGMEWDTLIYD